MEYKFRTLKAEEIDCRVSQIASNWLTLLLYKDARVDQNILDETVGCMNWQKSYLRENANCIVSLWDEDKKQWVSKEDTGTESFSEAEKGLASDSFKRACFNWGIGRELYTSPSIIIFPRQDMAKKGQDSEFFEKGVDSKGNPKYDTKTRFWVEYIDYDENRNIVDLIIRDNKNNIRFSELTKETEQEINKKMLEFKKLVEKKEETEDWDRTKLYEYYKVESDSQLTLKQIDEITKLLKKKGE